VRHFFSFLVYMPQKLTKVYTMNYRHLCQSNTLTCNSTYQLDSLHLASVLWINGYLRDFSRAKLSTTSHTSRSFASSLRQERTNKSLIATGISEIVLYATKSSEHSLVWCLWSVKAMLTRHQYASPPRGNAVPAGPLSDFWAIFYTKLGMDESVPGP